MKKNLLTLSLYVLSVVGVTYGQTLPVVARKNIEWQPTTPTSNTTTVSRTGFIGYGQVQSQIKSAEDWWYDVKPVGGSNPGYIACGFTTFLNVDFGEQTMSPRGFMPTPPTFTTMPTDIGRICGRRVAGNNSISNYKSTVGFYNLEGELQWTKTIYTGGALNSIMPTSDGGFIAVGDCRAAYKDDLQPYVYNPTTADMNNVLTKINPIGTAGITAEDYYWHDKVCVVKLDASGNVQWSYLYGYPDLNSTLANNSTQLASFYMYGVDLDVNPSGGYTLLGLGKWLGNSDQLPVLFNIDANGMLLSKQSYPYTYYHTGVSPTSFWVKAIDCEGGNCVFTGGIVGSNVGDRGAGLLWKVNQNTLAPVTTMTNNPTLYPNDADPDHYTYNNILEDVVLNTDGTIVCAALKINTGGYTSSNSNYGEGAIVKFNANGSTSNETAFGDVRAYDLRLGITKLSGGGYAVVTSKSAGIVDLDGSVYNPIITNYTSQSGLNCKMAGDPTTDDWRYSSAYWNTDTYVAKFDNNLVMKWERAFDSDNQAPVNYPGDFKKQECMYRIAEGTDGGLFVAGNSSHNVDDYFSAKIFSDCQYNYSSYDIGINYTVPSSTTWSIGKKIKGLVTIPSGVTLTINNGAVIQFADTRRVGMRTGIVIQPGGKLIVTGNATLTSFTACADKAMWDGIEVQGTYNVNQATTASQGILEITDGYITDARIAATTSARLADGSQDWTHTGGGIIKSTRGHYTNCNRAFEFRAYTNHNASGAVINDASFIVNSTFEVNSSYSDGSSTVPGVAQITMNAVRNVVLNGNSFTDSRPITTALPLEKHTIGIFAIDAPFTIGTYCTSGLFPCPAGSVLKSSFSNLSHGVYVSGGTANELVTVDQALFTNNMIGVRVEGAHYGAVQRCTFDVPKLLQTGTTPMGVGAYFASSYGIKVDENTFNSTGAGVTGSQSMGVYIQNSDAADGGMLHYRNTFNNLSIGTETADDNLLLQIECNWFNKQTNGKVDLYIPAASALGSPQGQCNGAATGPIANKFSGTCTLPSKEQILNNGLPFTYNDYSSTYTGLSLSCVTQTPTTNKVTVNVCGSPTPTTYVEANACPTHFTGGKLGMMVLEDPIALNAEIAAKKTQVPSDEVISQAINNLPAQDAVTTLLINSPYISATHLKGVIDANAPADTKATILSANSPLPADVIQYLQSSTLPQDVINQLSNVSGQSPAEELQDELHYLKVQKQLLDNDIVMDHLSRNHLDLARQYLADQNTIPTLMQLITISMQEPADVLNTLFDQLRTERNKLTANDKELASNVDQFLHFYTWRATHMNIDEISIDDLEEMASYYKEHDIYSDMANGIRFYLNQRVDPGMVYDLDYKPTPEVEEGDSETETTLSDNLLIYPNPTTGSLSVDVTEDDAELQSISVYSLDGKMIQGIDNISETKYSFDIPQGHSGMFIIEIHTTVKGVDKVTFKKVVVKQ